MSITSISRNFLIIKNDYLNDIDFILNALLYDKNRPMANYLHSLAYTYSEYFKCNAVPLMMTMMLMICSHAKQVCLSNSERTIENVKIHLKSRVIHSIIYLLCNCHSLSIRIDGMERKLMRFSLIIVEEIE